MKRRKGESPYEVQGKYQYTVLEVLLAYLLTNMKCGPEELDPSLVPDKRYQGDITAYVADLIIDNGIPIPRENIRPQRVRPWHPKDPGTPASSRNVVFAPPSRHSAALAKRLRKALLSLLA
jgi:hypothetical protein